MPHLPPTINRPTSFRRKYQAEGKWMRKTGISKLLILNSVHDRHDILHILMGHHGRETVDGGFATVQVRSRLQ